jgi:hypothetical protein
VGTFKRAFAFAFGSALGMGLAWLIGLVAVDAADRALSRRER